MGAPALLDAQADAVLDRINSVAGFLGHHVIGGFASNGGTTQATGANTAPNLDLDTTAIAGAVVNGVAHFIAAGTDVVATGGDSIDFAATSGKSAVVALVFETGAANDTPAWTSVAGAVADTGDEAAPTDAEILAAVGHSNWIRVADATLNRTGDTTITIAIDNTVRPTVPSFADLSVTESEFQAS